jgi:small-conductance mechanosensitive channel
VRSVKFIRRTQVFWYPIAFLTPRSLAGLAVAGYLYTGVRLNIQLNRSLFLVVGVVTAYQLVPTLVSRETAETG